MKKEIEEMFTSISEEEKSYLGLLAEMVQLRVDQNKTQRELADMTGLKQAAIARLESPASSEIPNAKTIFKYLNALGYELTIRPKKK
ncbi:helix-turn-helix domain-containing protein [[Brevibacterium] frigoritolerans]|nr:helix-turn-helix domain-containing protein [Peribacillus frigoritolerans]